MKVTYLEALPAHPNLQEPLFACPLLHYCSSFQAMFSCLYVSRLKCQSTRAQTFSCLFTLDSPEAGAMLCTELFSC